MVSPLLTLVANQIAAGFNGVLLPGTLRRTTPGTTLNSLGDPTSTTVTTYVCQGIVDTYDKKYRVQAGIPDTDVKLLLIAGLVDVAPIIGDEIKFRDQWYRAVSVALDPANATYTMQASAIPDPS